MGPPPMLQGALLPLHAKLHAFVSFHAFMHALHATAVPMALSAYSGRVFLPQVKCGTTGLRSPFLESMLVVLPLPTLSFNAKA